METYVTLYKYTGAISGGGPARFAEVQKLVSAGKGEIVGVYGLLGAYDIVSIGKFPNNRTAMKVAAQVGNLIGAKTHTMPAVERDDFLQLLTEL